MDSLTSSTKGNPWFGVTMLLIGVIVGYGAAQLTGTGGTADAPAPTVVDVPEQPEPEPVPPVTDDDWIRGNPDAEISVIEYSDFECPFCARHHPTMIQLLEEYGDQVNWVHRHFPLSFHPNAQKAAEAAECAGELGGNDAFWEYGDTIFDNGADSTRFVGYAENLGLDTEEFQTCLDSGKYAQRVADQMAGGSAAGVTGTPGNIVIHNESGEAQLIPGAQPITAFQQAIDELL